MRLLVYSEVVYTLSVAFLSHISTQIQSLLNHTHSHTNLHSAPHSSKSRTNFNTQAKHARPTHTPPSLTSKSLKNTNPPHPLHTQTPPSSSKRRTSRPHSLPTSEILDQILARRNISFVRCLWVLSQFWCLFVCETGVAGSDVEVEEEYCSCCWWASL
ncbi:hypothetical protein D6D05_01451, partial [Aureobasidium pullulans]